MPGGPKEGRPKGGKRGTAVGTISLRLELLLSLCIDDTSLGVRRGDMSPRVVGGVVVPVWAVRGGMGVGGVEASEDIAMAADGPKRP